MQNHQHLRSPIFDFGTHQQFRYSNVLNNPVVVASNANNLLEEEDPLPSFEEFQGIINDYLHNLSPKKRDKALVDHARYCLIQEVLKNPRNTSISTAQFRFWVKKMFQLQPGSYDLVCHDNKPVAMREQIYDILVNAHKEAHHGGRDKTSAIVRNQFSWIPKELVARFVRQCPTCINRRNGSQSLSAYTSKTSSPRFDYSSSSAPAYTYDIAAVAAATAAAAAASNSATTPTLLYTPSSKAESDISTSPLTTDHTFRRSPINNYNIISPSPPNKRPFFGQNGLFDSGSDQFTQLNYPIQTSPSTSRSPFYRRRSSTQMPVPQMSQQSQPEFMNYSSYSENTPSYYKTIINSYQNESVLDPNSISANPTAVDFSSATTATQSSKPDAFFEIDQSSSILSHNTDASSSL
ncbi:hypothetical protein [Parasitella parasitica]|uniref:Integrase zinc-binding domain-containing protein n=1 Tax=Parasitella parasitica TaxID=35722 RepID=A0A0B7NM56_9FUNG|nr:hypothetical protein [Parasitella parasitica]